MIRLSFRAIVIALMTYTAHAGMADAQTNVRTLSITWSGDQPSQVYVDRDGLRETLHLDDQQGVFTRTLQVAEARVDATIAAEYAADETASLPVYLLDYRPALAVTFHQAANLPCSNAVVTRLEQRSNNFQTNLQAYFNARALALRTGPNRCGSVIRPRVIKAWYDRSYDLAARNENFRIDPDAESAFNNDASLMALYPQHVALYGRRLSAAEQRWTYIAAIEASERDDPETSALLLRRIQANLEGNDAVRRDALAFENLSVEIVGVQLGRVEAMQRE